MQVRTVASSYGPAARRRVRCSLSQECPKRVGERAIEWSPGEYAWESLVPGILELRWYNPQWSPGEFAWETRFPGMALLAIQ